MRQNYINQIELAISSMHAANKTISNSYGANLSLLDLALLSELHGNSSLSCAEIAKRTNSTAVKVSRCVKLLKNSGLVIEEKRTRPLTLSLSKLGLENFKETYKIEQKIFTKALKRLPEKLRPIFTKGLKELNKQLKAPAAVRLTNDPEFLPEIRSLTRALGFLSGSPYNFKQLSSLDWHILRAFYTSHSDSTRLSAQQLVTRFAIPAPTIFSALQRLQQQDFLNEFPSRDRREQNLALSPAGKKIFEAGLKQASELLDRSLIGLNDRQLQDFAEACSVFADLEPLSEIITVSPSLLIKVANNNQQLQVARRIIFKARTIANKLENLPAQIAAQENLVILIYQHRVALAVIEFNNKGELLHLVSIPGTITKQALKSCYQIVLSSFAKQIDSNLLLTNAKNAATPECLRAMLSALERKSSHPC